MMMYFQVGHVIVAIPAADKVRSSINDDGFCIKVGEFRVKIGEFGITNGEFGIKNDELYIKNDGFRKAAPTEHVTLHGGINNDEFRVQHYGFCITNDEFCIKTRCAAGRGRWSVLYIE